MTTKRRQPIGNKFLKISYEEVVKGWLEDCCQACQADRVRGFLMDFIDYVRVTKETELLSEQDRMIVDYICNQPSNRLRIAHSVASTLREVQRRIVKDFQTALEKRLTADFGDAWQVTHIREEQLLEKWNVFKVSKGQWGGRFAPALSFEGQNCVGLTFGIFKSDQNAPHIPGLRSRMDQIVVGREWPHWEWEFPVAHEYKDWSVPGALERLAEKDEALNYFADWFLKIKSAAEPSIDDWWRPTQPDA
jgi:hypothetical protein